MDNLASDLYTGKFTKKVNVNLESADLTRKFKTSNLFTPPYKVIEKSRDRRSSSGCSRYQKVHLPDDDPDVSRCLSDFKSSTGRTFRKLRAALLVLIAACGLLLFYLSLNMALLPGIATMRAGFEPASCTLVYAVQRVGRHECVWSSCKEGCTADLLFHCWQVLVHASMRTGDHTTFEDANLTLKLGENQLQILMSQSTGLGGQRPRTGALEQPSELLDSRSGLEDRQQKSQLQSQLIGVVQLLDEDDKSHRIEHQPIEVGRNFTPRNLSSLHNDPNFGYYPEIMLENNIVKDISNWSSLLTNESNMSLEGVAKMLVNAQGCGYMTCAAWYRELREKGTRKFPCYLAKDGDIAVEDVDYDETKMLIVIGSAPLVMGLSSIIFIYILYCRKGSKDFTLTLELNPEQQKQKQGEARRRIILKLSKQVTSGSRIDLQVLMNLTVGQLSSRKGSARSEMESPSLETRVNTWTGQLKEGKIIGRWKRAVARLKEKKLLGNYHCNSKIHVISATPMDNEIKVI